MHKQCQALRNIKIHDEGSLLEHRLQQSFLQTVVASPDIDSPGKARRRVVPFLTIWRFREWSGTYLDLENENFQVLAAISILSDSRPGWQLKVWRKTLTGPNELIGEVCAARRCSVARERRRWQADRLLLDIARTKVDQEFTILHVNQYGRKQMVAQFRMKVAGSITI